MAGKEKKVAGLRQLNKDNLIDHDKSIANEIDEPKRRGRKPRAATPVTSDEPRTRIARKRKTDEALASAEDSKLSTPQRNRKQFLEKELEDLLENATGRNTPLDDGTFFIPKSRREPDDDTLSVRSLSNPLRSRRGADKEVEDDVLSLRSVKVRKDDDDALSVRSLPGRPAKAVRNPVKTNVTAPANTKGKVGKTKPKLATAAVVKKKAVKAKELKQIKKKTIKLPTKIAAKKRSALLLKKKVRNAKIAVKRIHRKKAIMNEKAGSSGTSGQKVETKQEAPVSVAERNGDISTATVKKVKVGGKKKALQNTAEVLPNSEIVKTRRGRQKSEIVSQEPKIANGPKPQGGKRRWENTIHYDMTPSPDDSSVIIVQPRIGPKARKMSLESNLAATPVAPAAASPAPEICNESSAPPPPPSAAPAPDVNGAATATASAPPSSPASTPYFIQTVANFNALKSQPTAQGDWLVTPAGAFLIQAVHPSERNSPPSDPSITTAAGNVSCVPPTCPVEDVTSEEDGSVVKEQLTPPTSSPAVAVVPSPQLSPVSLSAAFPSSSSSKGSSIASPTPSLSDSAIAPSSVPAVVETTAEPPMAVTGSSSPTLSGSAVAPAPSQCGAAAPNSMISEKAKEAEPAEAVALPRIPVAKNVQELLELKSQMDIEGPSTTVEVQDEHKAKPLFTENLVERRFSHDGSFAPIPARITRRTGSCERLMERSPKNVLELESKPLLITSAELSFKTDSSSSSSMALPSAISSSLESIKSDYSSEPPACDATKNVEKPGQVKEDCESLMGSQENNKNGCASMKEESMSSLNDDPAEKAIPLGRTLKEEHRSAGRTKKYSRSLDSRQNLMQGLRRRSHPEPKIINIVTSEDGSRQGLALAEELRHKITSADSATSNDSVDSNFPPQVPYPEQPINLPAVAPTPDAAVSESPEDLASKEAILRALGLRSLKAAAEDMEQRKKEQMMVVAASTNNCSNYTGTLKTVIKISRPEKKGNGRMIYKASSAGAGAGPASGSVPEVPAGTELEDSPTSKESAESGDEDAKNGTGKAKALVIPEKASSFSIHPHRMCSDVCTYCFGKFGLLDTPCHIAQLKDSEKRRTILDGEVHLTLDSCLCDACFRHVDKRSSGSSYTEKSTKRQLMVRKRKEALCCVENCELPAQHSVRRKSLIKLKNSLSNKLALDQAKLEKLIPANQVTLCNRHIYWVDYFMSCGICNKRLSTVHMYRVGPEVLELNGFLGVDGIPAVLTEKRFLCKLCQCYASIRLKTKDPSEMNVSQRNFYESCRRKILQCHGIEVPDFEVETELSAEAADKMKNKVNKKLKPSSTVTNGDYETDASQSTTKVLADDFADLRAKFKPTGATTKDGFHKCSTTIQFSKATKDLFYQLQQPHGNHSSFFRHLVMLEKYFRSGDLVLSPKADPLAVKYVSGVQNRLRSYDGVPKVSSRPFTLTPVPTSTAASTSSAATSASTPSTPSAIVTRNRTPTPQPSPAPLSSIPPPASLTVTNPLSQLQSAVHNIGIKPDISISSVGSEPRKLTPKIQENLRALANRASKPGGQTRAVILNRTVGGQKQSLVQVTTGGKTIHLTLSQFRRIQQMQIRKKQYLENQAKGGKPIKPKSNGPNDASDVFPHIPKALSVSVSKVSSVDLTKSPPKPD